MVDIRKFPRHGLRGYFSLADLPQKKPIEEIALETGWWELDQIYRPYPGQFTMLTGFPGHGKSTFAFNLIVSLVRKHHVRCFLYVPENESHISQKLRRIWPADDEAGFAKFSRQYCFVQSVDVESGVDEVGIEVQTLGWLLDRAAESAKRDGTSIVLFDPWNEIEKLRQKDQSMTEYVGECLFWLKKFCRLYDAIVYMIAHPTKEAAKGGKPPAMHDIEGSMQWYNKADNGLVVWREDPEKDVTTVISTKVREPGAGKVGKCYFSVKDDKFTPVYGAVS